MELIIVKKKKCPKICNTCVNCVYIGEGDFICDYEEPVLIMEDFTPSDDFMYCNGENYESEEDYEREFIDEDWREE